MHSLILQRKPLNFRMTPCLPTLNIKGTKRSLATNELCLGSLYGPLSESLLGEQFWLKIGRATARRSSYGHGYLGWSNSAAAAAAAGMASTLLMATAAAASKRHSIS